MGDDFEALLGGLPPAEEPAPVSAILSAEQVEKLRAQARKNITAEREKAEMARLLEQFEDAERVAQGLAPKYGAPPEDEKVLVTVSIPKFAPYLAIDGQRFYHGLTYPVTAKQGQFLAYQMQLSWLHEEEVQGRSRFDWYRREKDIHISPIHGKVNTSSSLGARV